MSEEKQSTFYPPSFGDVPSADLFTSEMPRRPGAEDLFTVPYEPSGSMAGKGTLEEALDYEQVASPGEPKRITNRQVLMMVGIGVALVGVAYLLWVPTPPQTPSMEEATQVAVQPKAVPDPGPVLPEAGPDGTLPLPQLQPETGPEEALSIGRAERMYEEEDFFNAYRVFYKIHEGMPDDPQYRAQKAFLLYRLALCQKGLGQISAAALIFREVASKTQVPLIMALGRYHQALAELHDESYFTAARRSRQALALIDVADREHGWIQDFKRSCGFIENKALTLHVLGLHDADHGLPDVLFQVPAVVDPFLGRDDESFLALLTSGLEQYDEAILGPRITSVESSLAVPTWKMVCQGTAVGDIINRLAKKTGLDVDWSFDPETEAELIDPVVKERPVHLYLAGVTDAQAVATIAGAAGLFAHRDANDVIHIANPQDERSLTARRENLTQWTIALWRTFIAAADGDAEYEPRAHFAQALLYEQTDQGAAALQEYLQVTSRYRTSELAPYALLNSSRLKTNTGEFDGARADLEQLYEQYPDVEFSGNALIYLADATLKAGQPAEAGRLFRRVYLLEMSPQSAAEAAFGAGYCASVTRQHKEATKWFGNYLRANVKKPQEQVTEAYFLLGQAFFKQGLYDKAQAALLQALERDAMGTYYVEALDSYVQAQIALGNYVLALEQLLFEPEFKFSRRDSNRIMILKAHVFRLMGSYPTAIAHLVDGLPALQEREELALANIELATCYELDGKLDLARYRYTAALEVLEPGVEAQRMQYKIAEMTLALGHADKAVELGTQILEGQLDASLRPKVLALLAEAHAQRSEFDKAAELMLRRSHELLPEPNAIEDGQANAGALGPGVTP